jgi:glycogen debranching enzyme
MRRRSVLGGLVMGAGASGAGIAAPAARRRAGSGATPVLDTLAIPVTREENRQYSFTDKVSGYFHGRTHTDANPDWFNGWNIATKRIFHDYQLSVDGVALSRSDAQSAVVSPHHIKRVFSKANETLSLLDGLAALVLQVENVVGNQIGLTLTGSLTDLDSFGPDGIWFTPKEAPGSTLLVAPITKVAVEFARSSIEAGHIGADHRVTIPALAGGFFIIHAQNKPEAVRILARVRRNLTALLAARAMRMEALVSGNHALDAGDPDRTKALLWMRLTGDQLVTRQLGTGIYAGLPWFNDYWGRDTFISITGLLFVNGQYEEAARVFESFAALQDIDPKSKTYGRVPNRARPDGIEYNSADGTPRFIITLADLVARSGDVALAKRLWPAVKRAVEGVLKNNVDELGLITHDDADTWMDAKEKGTRAWSPRGNRAVDVQALWVEALYCARWFSEQLFDPVFDPRRPFHLPPSEIIAWQLGVDRAAQRLSTAMVAFRHPVTGFWVDRLKADGTQDLMLRPNVLFTVGQRIYNESPTLLAAERDMKQLREVWEGLVYPWGVATLSQDDPNFYPFHEHWNFYHKDAAYHNGTVWPWLNGMAIEQMVKFNQIGPAWSLFENMNRQALKEGAVGSLAECADALPMDAAHWSRRTGTFLQAWSNAEHLRVWQTCFLGFSQDAFKEPNVRSRLPDTVKDVRCSFRLPSGRLDGHFHIGGAKKWRFIWQGPEISLRFNALFYGEVVAQVALKNNWSVVFSMKDNTLISECYDENGKSKSGPDPYSDLTGMRAEYLARFQLEGVGDESNLPRDLLLFELQNTIFANLDFCKPRLQPNLKSLSVRHDPPLTY